MRCSPRELFILSLQVLDLQLRVRQFILLPTIERIDRLSGNERGIDALLLDHLRLLLERLMRDQSLVHGGLQLSIFPVQCIVYGLAHSAGVSPTHQKLASQISHVSGRTSKGESHAWVRHRGPIVTGSASRGQS